MNCDLTIRNGLVVSPQGSRALDLAIDGGRIVGVISAGSDFRGQTDIDASGKVVIPGLVDAHVHIPGWLDDDRLDDFHHATLAAAAGGVTTVLLQPTDHPQTSTVRDFESKRDRGTGRSFVDFGLQALVGPEQADIEALAELGAVSFELYLAYGGNPSFVVGNDDLALCSLMRQAHETGRVVCVTPHSPSLIARLTALARQAQVQDFAALASTRPVVSEAFGIARACVAAEEAGARLHLRALSSGRTASMLSRFSNAIDLSSEVISHHLLFTREDVHQLGPYGVIIPPFREEADRSALRSAVREGRVDMVVSDHSPLLREDKEVARQDVWRTPPGMPGLQTSLLSLLQLVGDQDLDLQQLVAAACERPARRFGLYPKKGAIAIGADADIVIIDPGCETRICDEDQLSRAGWTPLAGTTVKASIESVWLRGRRICERSRSVGRPSGAFVRPS